MTSLMCWVGADSRGPASVYITTDSRISWNADAWDLGRKTFASTGSPDVLGYCGDVLFPALVLSQYEAALNAGLQAGPFDQRHNALQQLVRVSFQAVPTAQRRDFTIAHCGRDGDAMTSVFHARLIRWSVANGFASDALRIGDESAMLHLDGTGAASVRSAITKRSESAARGTTRALFRAFVDALESGADRFSGGAPQLVGMYRTGSALSFGVLYRGRRFLHGMPVHDLAPNSEVEWRNDLFERADGTTRRRLPGTQRHRDL